MADQIRTAPDWEDIRIFIALARHGSLSAAARALSVNHATIARRIASLERTLGERLVERRPDGYVLTLAGNRALQAASDMETAAATLRRGGADESPRGVVRLSATPGLAQSFLVERLARLAARHSGLDIEVATDVRLVSLERREADIALRLGRPQDGDVVAKRLVNFGFGFYASSEWCHWLENGVAPVFVGFDEANAHLPEAIWLARRFPEARTAFRTSNQFAQAAAAKADAGVALLPHFIGRADDNLSPCLQSHELPPSRELWLVTRRHDSKDLAIVTVVDFLMQVFRGERDLFE
ncbi:LysR family transcriptional regulator [Agrobacterium rhizogenes]|uniref:LysR family transcriptional regulator n=2 Tax=unclassified Rhizobium TaxID=2613769 RepID=A0AAU7S9J8_9HYPH|nr:LysR family transcriptional regulator [Rhizobium rhizogenes]NTJ78922.1 LysR family transcriptional regulator [Rhizobium rhizogenes]